jgi:aconitase B
VHLDPDVPVGGEHVTRALGVRCLQQDGRAQRDTTVVGRQWTTGAVISEELHG